MWIAHNIARANAFRICKKKKKKIVGLASGCCNSQHFHSFRAGADHKLVVAMHQKRMSRVQPFFSEYLSMTLELQSGHKLVITDMLLRVCAPLDVTQPANLEQTATVRVN